MTPLDLEFVSPAYERACLTDLMPSVIDGLGLPGAFDIIGLGPLHRVAVILIDGLGARQVARFADEVPFLAAALDQELTSVFPSTTPAGLTSLGTGLSPGSHGLVGASFRLGLDNRVLHPLSWSNGPSVNEVQPEPTLWRHAMDRDVAVSIVGPRAYRESGLTRASLGGAPYVGADGPGERVQGIVDSLSGPGPRLVYGYWEWLDKTAHVHGVSSAAYLAELKVVEQHLQSIVAMAPRGSTVIATADHGVIDCPEIFDLDLVPELKRDVRLVAGEPRMRHIYVAPGMQDQVAETYRRVLGDRAVVFTRGEVIEEGLFGRVQPDVEVRIGDVVALARNQIKLTCPSRDSIVSGLVGQHGSLTAEEMMIPLLRWQT